jgi:hypothetical protein
MPPEMPPKSSDFAKHPRTARDIISYLMYENQVLYRYLSIAVYLELAVTGGFEPPIRLDIV